MSGRWPTNVILSPDMAGVLDKQSGTSKSAKMGAPRKAGTELGQGSGWNAHENKDSGDRPEYGDEGGASRFFLNAGYESWELEWIYKAGLRPCGMEAPDVP